MTREQEFLTIQRSATARNANEALRGADCRHTAPKLSTRSDRETLIGWLCCVDGNGVWTDKDMRAEGWDPMSIQDAWDQIDVVLDQSR